MHIDYTSLGYISVYNQQIFGMLKLSIYMLYNDVEMSNTKQLLTSPGGSRIYVEAEHNVQLRT